MKMKKTTNSISLFVLRSIFFLNWSSTTLIQSNPSKAKLYIDGEYVGKTPYMHRDSRIVGSNIEVKIEKEGYMPLITSITKNEEANVGAIVAGLFVYIPFLWLLKYKPMHIFELQPIGAEPANMTSEQ